MQGPPHSSSCCPGRGSGASRGRSGAETGGEAGTGWGEGGGVGEPGGGWGRAGASGPLLCPSLPSKTMGCQLREIRGWVGAQWNHSLRPMPGGRGLPQGWPPTASRASGPHYSAPSWKGGLKAVPGRFTRAPILTPGLSHSRTTSSFLPPSTPPHPGPPLFLSLSFFKCKVHLP